MGRYNRQARRKMRKNLGAGAKISNDALETAIDIQRDGGKRFANEELPASALAFPVFKDSEKSDPMKNTECLLPEYLDEYFRDKKIDGETVTLLRGEKYGKIAVRVGAELYYVSYGPMKNWSCEENEND